MEGIGSRRSGGPTGASLKRSVVDATTVVVAASGELDLAAAPSIKWALSDELREGAVHVILDLAQARFLDSTVIGVLVAFERNLPTGGRLSLVAPQPEVLSTFRITGLDSSFHIFSSLREALADFGRPDAPPADRAQSS